MKKAASKLRTYSVAIPITGVVYTEVDAENKEDAIRKALESEDVSLDNVEDWSSHKHVVQGNVFYGKLAQAEAELLPGQGDDDE